MSESQKDVNGNPILPLEELVSEGYLQEVNRRFLHPLGLALTVHTDDSQKYGFIYIQDHRDSLDGMYFADLSDSDSLRKVNNIERLLSKKGAARRIKIGRMIQPIGSKMD